MATVNSATTTSAADTFAALNGTAKKTATSNAADAENKFLTLLMTQIKNQDPLNPMDNAQMTSQLAQISMLEGIQGLNTTLTTLLSSYNTSQALQAAGAIGSNVLVEGNRLALTNGQAQGAATLGSSATSVIVTIKDSTGKTVQTQELGKQPAGTVAFEWDGKNANGTQVPDGNYSFSVEASANGSKVSTTPIQLGTVSAVVRSGTSFVLELSSGETVAFDDVLQFM